MKKIALVVLLLLLVVSGQAQKGKTQALTALGGSCGLLLYNTHMVLGIAADAFAGEVYGVDDTRQIIGEQLGGVETVVKQYTELLNSGFITDPKDVTFMKDLLKAFALVEQEAQSLDTFVATGDVDVARTYDEDRKVAWAEIARLLGMEE